MAFLIAAVGGDGSWRKTIMSGQLKQGGIKMDGLGTPLKDGTFKVVIQHDTRHGVKVGERIDVAA